MYRGGGGDDRSKYGDNERIKYVPVPVEVEKIVKVPKTEIVWRTREVKRFEKVYKDRVIEVPKVKIVEEVVEVPEYVDDVKYIPRKKVIDLEYEVVTYVPKTEVEVRELAVEVPGSVIEVKVDEEITREETVTHYNDTVTPVIVAQTFTPLVTETSEKVMKVPLKKFVPCIIPLEIFVPVAVDRQLISGTRETTLNAISADLLPNRQYNTQVKQLNPNVHDQQLASLYRRDQDGSVSFLQTVN